MTILRAMLLLIGMGLASSCPAWCQDESDGSPRALSGLSASHAYEINDLDSWNPEDDILLRLLYRIGKVSARSLEQYRQQTENLSWSTIGGDAPKYRFGVYSVSGTVRSVTPCRLSESAAADVSGYFLVELETGRGPFRLIARNIPARWKGRDALGQRVSATGFFFRLLPVGEARSEDPADQEWKPVLIVDSIQWYPDQPAPGLGVGPAQLLLAEGGVDLARWDTVRRLNRMPLKAEDAPLFHSLLDLTSRLDRSRFPETRTGFLDILSEPTSHFGDAVSLRAKVARCVSIVEDSDPVSFTDAPGRYYELDLFYLLEPGQVIFVDDTEYRARFPVTVCTSRLPAGFTPAQLTGRTVDIDGFFYRFWKYPSEFTGAEGGQLCPLIIAMPPEIVTTSARLLNRFLMITLMVILLVLAGVSWYVIREPNRSGRRATSRLPVKIELPDDGDLGGDGRA